MRILLCTLATLAHPHPLLCHPLQDGELVLNKAPLMARVRAASRRHGLKGGGGSEEVYTVRQPLVVVGLLFVKSLEIGSLLIDDGGM